MTSRQLTRCGRVLGCLSCLCLIFAAAQPAAAKPALGLKKVATVKQPTSLASPPGYPRLIFVTEREGKLRIIRGQRLLRKPLLDLSARTDPLFIERGVLGLAFPPDFRRTGRFYVDFTARNGDVIVAAFRTRKGRPGQLVKNSYRQIIRIPRVHETGNHNGGHLAFRGNQLFISVGDGNDPGDAADLARNPASLRGKILRIIPRPDADTGLPYRIPAGNPFVGGPGREEVFAYGLRNPHRFGFHRSASGDPMMLVYDVGQLRYEELNYLPLAEARGANFGWKSYEGLASYDCGEVLCTNGAVPLPGGDLKWPELVYSHEQGCAIIGGPVIRDPALKSFRGEIIYGDFCSNRIRLVSPDGTALANDRPAGFFLPPGKGRHPAHNGFGVDGLNRVYAFSNFGPIYRLIQR